MPDDGWVRITQDAIHHKKQIAAGPEACWLWVAVIAYCQTIQQDTVEQMRLYLVSGMSQGKAVRLAKKLVEVGLLEPVKGGFRVHDYIRIEHPKGTRAKIRQGVFAMRCEKAPRAWQTIELSSRYRIPREWNTPGVYAIYLDGKLTYIGQSEAVRNRLSSHLQKIRLDFGGTVRTPWGPATEVAAKFKPCRRHGEWLMREARLIRRLRPRGNTSGINQPVAFARG